MRPGSSQKKISLPAMCSLENPNAAVMVQISTNTITAAAMTALLRKKPGKRGRDSTVT